MKIIICKCKQCKGKKKGDPKNVKARMRRLLNKKRRKGKEGQVFNYYRM